MVVSAGTSSFLIFHLDLALEALFHGNKLKVQPIWVQVHSLWPKALANLAANAKQLTLGSFNPIFPNSIFPLFLLSIPANMLNRVLKVF